MKLRNIRNRSVVLALAASFIVPQLPTTLMAQIRIRPSQPFDLFPADDDTGLFPIDTAPGNIGNPTGGIGTRPGANTGGNTGAKNQRTGKVSMFPAKVPEEYSCSLFDNNTHDDIFAAIDSLTKVVNPAGGKCSGEGTAGDSLQKSALNIKNSIATLKKLMQNQDPATIQPAQIEQTVTTAVTAIAEIGAIIENNEFLNSDCGKQTMSTGKVLIALNQIINGLSPFLLQASTVDPTMLPYLIGGSVASSAIKTVAKMSDQKTLSMDVDEHRKALLQNTCQFMKIVAKQRLMELAQDGKLDYVKSQLKSKKELYTQRYNNPGGELNALLSLRKKISQETENSLQQVNIDKNKLDELNAQISTNDDLLICITSNEFVQAASDGQSFPASIMANLEAALKKDPSQTTQARIRKTYNSASMKRIAEAAARVTEDERSLKACAQASRAWIKSLQQTIDLTAGILNKTKSELDKKISSTKGYSYWITQYNRAQTIENFEKALDELEKPNSISRSEISQRMDVLKASLFGSRSMLNKVNPFLNGRPPVLEWIYHTKEQYAESMATFKAELEQIRDLSYSLTPASGISSILITPKLKSDSRRSSKYLENINLNYLTAGTKEYDKACQTLEAASTAYNSSMTHLRAIELFCNLIGPTLDTKVDERIKKACGDDVDLRSDTKSIVQEAERDLNIEGVRNDAALIQRGQKRLSCPGFDK